MSNKQNRISIISDNIKKIIRHVLTNLNYSFDEIEDIIENDKIINSMKESENIFVDFKITVPYKEKENLFDLGEVLKTADQEEVILYFSNQAKLKEVKIIYRDDINKSNIIIILDGELKFYDFVIKMDDLYSIIKKEATLKIKDNLISLSNIFQSHKSILLSMIDDVLSDENNYFKVGHTKINPITPTGLNPFTLTTTAIYSGIVSQYTPLKINYGSALNSTYNETCEIMFDRNQNIEKLFFKMHKNRNGKLEKIKIGFNKKFEIINIDWKICNMMAKDKMIVDVKFNHHELPIEDVIKLIRLKFNLNESIMELMPEITVPSAYNFTNDEFSDRLKIAEMMLD